MTSRQKTNERNHMVGFYYLASYILFIAYQDSENDHDLHPMEEAVLEDKQDEFASTVLILVTLKIVLNTKLK